MVKAREATQLTAHIRERLTELKWTQKRLSVESDIVYSTLNDILNGKIPLSAENAEKLAAVPELKTTKEAFLRLAGVWSETRPSRKRDVAIALFDQLTSVEQDLSIDFMVMIAQRGRDNEQPARRT